MAEAPSPPRPAPAKGSWIAPRTGWSQLAHLDRRAWIAIGVIAGGAAFVGGALGMGAHRSSLFPALLMAAAVVSAARMGWSWLRGRSRRARLREGVLTRVEQYGGGVYGTGAGMTLLVLSAVSLRKEWTEAAGLMDFLRGMTVQWWIGFSGESIRNAVQAGIWPIHWLTNHGMAAVLVVAAAAWLGDAVADAWRRREPLPVDGDGAETAGAVA